MPALTLSSRFEVLLKRSVARGLLPFDWGAARSHGSFSRSPAGGAPTTFSEKVRYKIRYDRRPILKIYADKLAVRDYVAANCDEVLLPRLLGVFDSADACAAHAPAGPWVMKASHGSSMILIAPPGKTPAERDIKRHAQRWLNTDYGLRHWEWQYFRLPRRVMFEEYLGDEHNVPADYKFYVIHHRVRFIEVDQDRYIRHTRDFFYPDWTPIRSRIGPAPTARETPARPASLERMIRIAEALSCDTDFVRVDLYAVRGDIYFGELTHSPAAGNFNFADPALDEYLGRDWVLPTRFEPRGDAKPARPARPALPSLSHRTGQQNTHAS